MNKIVSFEKEIVFKTNIGEIMSISLERNLNIGDDLISGEFIISGEYKITSASTTVEPFEYQLPLDISIDEQYDTHQAIIDIDDFYYEVINDNILKINIDLKIDKLKEKEIIDMDTTMDREDNSIIEEVEEKEEVLENIPEKMNSLFSNMTNVDNYVSYNIYIVRENDDLNTIIDKYQISEEALKLYNDLTNLEVGTKLIIPSK